MDPDVITFAQVMVIIVSSVAGLVVVGLGARVLWNLGSRPPRALPAEDPARLRQIESAVEAIAIEVERISEAQRYTVSLLSDRLPVRNEPRLGAAPLTPLPRVDTPH